MKKIETCFICKLGIDINKDHFVEIKEYNKGKHYRSIFAHKNCWMEHFSNKIMMRNSLLRANKMLDEAMRKAA